MDLQVLEAIDIQQPETRTTPATIDSVMGGRSDSGGGRSLRAEVRIRCGCNGRSWRRRRSGEE